MRPIMPTVGKTSQVLSFLTSQQFEIKENNTIIRQVDASCKMASVSLNGKVVMTGNYWDFHKDCHGFDLPNFSSSSELATLLENALLKSGKTVENVLDKNWKWTD